MSSNTENKQIEIYVRPGSEHNMMNIYVPMAMKEQILEGIANGSFDVLESAINFEISIQPKWITDSEERIAAERSGYAPHVRIPLKAINLIYSEE